MNKYFDHQINKFNERCTLYYFIEQPDGALFTERLAYYGQSIKMADYKFVRMETDNIPVFKMI